MSRSSSVRSIAAAVFVVLAACGGDKAASDTAAAGTTATAAAGPTGESLYQQRCVTCHQLNGQGTTGVYPPLAGSEYATAANVAVPIRIVLHGIQGPITVKGAEYNSLMPAFGIGIDMPDAQVASLLTYIRTSWGNAASPVTTEDVARERAASKDIVGAVTAELLKPLMGN